MNARKIILSWSVENGDPTPSHMVKFFYINFLDELGHYKHF